MIAYKPSPTTSPASALRSEMALNTKLNVAPPCDLPVTLAQQRLQAAMTPLVETETLPLMVALGRILAIDVMAPINVPAHDNAAMDGYAFNGAFLQEGGKEGGKDDDERLSHIEFDVVARAFAGHPVTTMVGAGECVRIMTGALIPPGADTVVPHEFAQVLVERQTHDASRRNVDGAATTSAEGYPARVALDIRRFARGANRRLAGEDLMLGQRVLEQGRTLRAADLGVLASLGIAEVVVKRRLRVAFFSTGDELGAVGQPLNAGGVYDSNRYTLHAMLSRIGAEAIDLGVVRDDPDALRTALAAGAACADAIISSGGVSVGDADFVKDVFGTMGQIDFWKLAMRPGRPFAFGRLIKDNEAANRIEASSLASISPPARDVPYFGLPGNPVAVMATFYHLVRDALLRMAGAVSPPVPRISARAATLLQKRPGRSEFARGIAQRQADGIWDVRLAGAQGSGILRSMSEANCFIMLDHDRTDVRAGDAVDIVFFDGLI